MFQSFSTPSRPYKLIGSGLHFEPVNVRPSLTPSFVCNLQGTIVVASLVLTFHGNSSFIRLICFTLSSFCFLLLFLSPLYIYVSLNKKCGAKMQSSSSAAPSICHLHASGKVIVTRKASVNDLLLASLRERPKLLRTRRITEEWSSSASSSATTATAQPRRRSVSDLVSRWTGYFRNKPSSNQKAVVVVHSCRPQDYTMVRILGSTD